MAKFTAQQPLNIEWHGNALIGNSTTTYRIPDALKDEFAELVAALIPGGVTWVEEDELADVLSISGGTLTGPLTAAAISAASLSATGTVTGGSGSFGVTNVASLSATGAIEGASAAIASASFTSVELNGGFTNAFDTDLWIAPANRADPSAVGQAIYAQFRISGSMSSHTMDAAAFEIRLTGISNATFLNALEASVVVTGGANTIPDVRALTTNVTLSGSPTGTITAIKMIAAQQIANATAATIGTIYGIYLEAQTAGGTNYSIYAPTGSSRLGVVQTDGDLTVGLGTGAPNIIINAKTSQIGEIIYRTQDSNRWIVRKNSTAESGSNAGSDLEFVARADDGSNLGTVMTLNRAGISLTVNGKVGFNGTAPIAKPTVSGSRASNAALASLLTALANYGLVIDSSTVS